MATKSFLILNLFMTLKKILKGNIFAGYTFMLDVGSNTTWASPSLPHLTSEDSDFPVTIDQSVWLLSTVIIFGAIGYGINSLIMNRIGRKYTILVGGLILLSSKILLALANSYTFLFMTKIIMSIGGSVIYSIVPIYIGEIVDEKIRGRFLIFLKICVNIGAFLMVTAGAFLRYNTMNLVMISLPLLGFVMFPLTLESPYYYLLKGRENEALETLLKLSGGKKIENIMTDIERVKTAIVEGQNSKRTSIRELFSDRGCRRALMIHITTQFTYCMSGYLAIQAYAQEILSNSGSSLAPEYSVMIMTGIQIFAGFPSSLIVDRWGRRPTFLLSGVLSSLSLAIVGLFFFLKFFLEVDVSSITWLPLVGLISFTFVCNMGLSTIPFVFLGELFSVKVKGVAILTGLITNIIFTFSVTMILPLVSNSVGFHTTFWIFAISCLLGSITVFCIAPETKGKTLEEVLEILSGNRQNVRKNTDC